MSREYVLHRLPSDHPKIDFRSALNEEQYEAVTSKPGPLLVIAGAGSGKTRTLTYRVAYLIENGVEPENILLLTFTNKAAREMLERVGQLLPQDLSRLWGGTFHGVANRMLRRHANRLGFSNSFTILDPDDCKEIVTACMQEAKWNRKVQDDLPKPEVFQAITSLAINGGKPLAEVVNEQYDYLKHLIPRMEEVETLFKARKKADNVMDYDDMLYYALELLRLPDVGQSYQEQFQHVLVDEYQDTNKIQSDFIDRVAAYHQQIMAVGDDAQSIYSWRGANFEYVMTFPERYPGARQITIETNYRSTPEILNLANFAIAGNLRQIPKNLIADRPGEKYAKPGLISLHDANQQAAFVAQRIGDLLEEGMELNEIAILYRSHFHSMELQMEFTRRGIPFELMSGIRFFEQAHVKDVAAFIKFSRNMKDEISFLRIMKLMPGVGPKTASKLWSQVKSGTDVSKISPPGKASDLWKQWLATHEQLNGEDQVNSPSNQIQTVIDAIYEDHMKTEFANYPTRLEDLAQLRSFAERYNDTEEFLAQLALMTSVDGGPRSDRKANDSDGPCVRFSTIHQAKGLEWKVVFIVMLCDGLFPGMRSFTKLENMEEERRLFYVAVTRAQNELYMTYPRSRPSSDGTIVQQEPSRFVADLNEELVVKWRILDDRAQGRRY